MTSPQVSFLLPVGPRAPFLNETLDSIKAQTMDSWHLVAVLDGPTPGAAERVCAVIPPDRLTLVELPENRGLPAALNAGLHATTTEFVARIDADDICLPHRLEKQLAAARAWREVIAVGGAAELIDEQGLVTGTRNLAHGRDIRPALIARNVLIHSSVLMRLDGVIRAGGYNALCAIREDYELWLRMSTLGALSAIEDPVVQYRLSDGQLSSIAPPKVSLDFVRVSQKAAARALGRSRSEAELRAAMWRLAQSGSGQRVLRTVRR